MNDIQGVHAARRLPRATRSRSAPAAGHLANAYGHDVDLEVYTFDPADVTGLLTAAGFAEVATLTRAPMPPEKEPQGYLLVRKPA